MTYVYALVACLYVYVERRRAVNDCNAQRSSTRHRIVINNNNNNAWLRIERVVKRGGAF